MCTIGFLSYIHFILLIVAQDYVNGNVDWYTFGVYICVFHILWSGTLSRDMCITVYLSTHLYKCFVDGDQMSFVLSMIRCVFIVIVVFRIRA